VSSWLLAVVVTSTTMIGLFVSIDNAAAIDAHSQVGVTSAAPSDNGLTVTAATPGILQRPPLRVGAAIIHFIWLPIPAAQRPRRARTRRLCQAKTTSLVPEDRPLAVGSSPHA
jgi:hypothetical protein